MVKRTWWTTADNRTITLHLHAEFLTINSRRIVLSVGRIILRLLPLDCLNCPTSVVGTVRVVNCHRNFVYKLSFSRVPPFLFSLAIFICKEKKKKKKERWSILILTVLSSTDPESDDTSCQTRKQIVSRVKIALSIPVHTHTHTYTHRTRVDIIFHTFQLLSITWRY